ncbi:MAG: transposase [Pseudomonadota bacterium]
MAQEILVDPERRRRWSDGEKIAILVEAAAPEATVTEVARRHGITRQHIYQWRSDMRCGRLVDETGGPFLAIEFVGGADDGGVPPDEPGCDGLIEITLRKGRVLRTPASIAPGVLTALIRAAEAA